MKQCIECGVTESRRWRKGYCSRCYRLERRKKNPEKHKKWANDWYKNNSDKAKRSVREYEKRYPIKLCWRRLRRAVRLSEIESNITTVQHAWIIRQPCFYCQKLQEEERGSWCDRIIGALGYQWENVLPCCWNCNSHRHKNWTVLQAYNAVQASLTPPGFSLFMVTQEFIDMKIAAIFSELEKLTNGGSGW